jgi:fatty-acyl-CoA synthase
MNMAESPDTGLGHTLLKRAAISPLERAITFEGQTQTYVQLALQVRKISAVLRDIGINKGDRVGYIGLNHPSFLEVLYACGCLGAIFVPINFRLTGPEVRFIANDAGLKVI